MPVRNSSRAADTPIFGSTNGEIIAGRMPSFVSVNPKMVPGVATLATELLVGWLLVIGGIFGLISVFQSGTSAPGFWWNLLTAILAALAGVALLYHPVAGMVTLTIVLASYLLATGVSKLLLAFNYRARIPRAWGWVLFSGLLDVLLGFMIVMGLPGTAVWAIGLLVGLNLLFTGVALLVAAFTCPQASDAPPAAAAKA